MVASIPRWSKNLGFLSSNPGGPGGRRVSWNIWGSKEASPSKAYELSGLNLASGLNLGASPALVWMSIPFALRLPECPEDCVWEARLRVGVCQVALRDEPRWSAVESHQLLSLKVDNGVPPQSWSSKSLLSAFMLAATSNLLCRGSLPSGDCHNSGGCLAEVQII